MHTHQARVVMITPLHDPAGALAPLVDRVLQRQGSAAAWARCQAALGDVRVLASEETAAVTCDAIRALGATVIRREDEGRAFMWAMTETALSMDATHVFMPDTDRLLHWLLTYPEELVSLSDAWGQHDVLVLARSPRAFLTHPLCQTLTEGPIKQLLASVLGVPGADPFSGAYLLSRRALEAIARSEAPRDESFYAEALLAPRHAGCRFEVRIVEGLEWETPDRFQKEIAARGYDGWVADFQNAAQWEYRSRMAALWIDRIGVYMVHPRR